MRITITSVLVSDQAHALAFYTDVLGFVKKHDEPVGADRWLTVVAPDGHDDVELLLEPNGHPVAGVFQKALFEDGIPFTSFTVDDVAAEHERLAARGVRFTKPPQQMPWGAFAIFDDTCGNLIQIQQINDNAG